MLPAINGRAICLILAKALTRPDRHPAQHRHRRTKFDGGVTFGRNASGNNTVFLYAWMAFLSAQIDKRWVIRLL